MSVAAFATGRSRDRLYVTLSVNEHPKITFYRRGQTENSPGALLGHANVRILSKHVEQGNDVYVCVDNDCVTHELTVKDSRVTRPWFHA